MMTKISILILALTLTWVQVFSQQIDFKIDGTKFMQKNDKNDWVDFGKFAGVNLGITKPGFEPGQVILNYNDYMLRFKYLKTLGVKMIRVYSLLQPDFYRAILDWNEENEEKLYVLQGTAFPELEMEHNNGTDAYDSHITELMKEYIHTTVAGVYGQGKVIYKYDYSNNDKKPVYGDYNYNIAKYLMGWVISGEISPFCIHATNYNKTTEELLPIKPYIGTHISSCYSKDQQNCNGRISSRFETWVAEMFDLLAIDSFKYGYMAPISHTNWVTTDGVQGTVQNYTDSEGNIHQYSNYSASNAIEPRFLGLDAEYVSIEDWMEFDLHNFDFFNWDAGMFFNQHAYPYYPEFIKIDGPDSYMHYIKIIRNYYKELPLIITEVGLPTSLGISSADKYNNFNHGHNSEKDQGDMMYEILTSLLYKGNVTGAVVFQIYDEWFKKSWNTLKYDQDKQKWKNILTSEQYFGIMDVSSHKDLKINSIKQANVEVYNNYEFVIIDIENVKPTDEIEIGLDIYPGGKSISNFKANNDVFIRLHEDNFDFKIHSKYDAYMLSAGLWIDASLKKEFIGQWEDSGKMRHECYKYTCEFLDKALLYTDYNDFKMLVKWPTVGMWTDPYCNSTTGNTYIKNIEKCTPKENVKIEEGFIANITEYDAHVYKVETKINTREPNLSLMERTETGVRIKIPYQMLGYSNPANHTKFFPKSYGKNYKVEYHKYDNDIGIDIFINNIDNLKFNYNWKTWTLPDYWTIKPKQGFNAFRKAFHELNYNKTITNLTQSQLDELIWHNRDPNELTFSLLNIHYYMVRGAIAILLVAFSVASIGKILGKFLCISYFESSQNIFIGSYRMICYNLAAVIGLLVYLALEVRTTFVVANPVYFLYIFLLMWDSFLLLMLVIFNKWNLHEEITEIYNTKEHAFVIACHNSSEVLEKTLKSLLEKVPGSQIYVADNGSSDKEQKICANICDSLDPSINYGHIAFDTKVNGKIIKRGNKTMSQYAAICSLNSEVKYVTCIDDDTRLDPSWDVNKAIKYFKDDEDVAVVAYPLTADNPKYDIEWFQAMEYLISGFFKIFHSKVYSTIFNSGAFGTYRVDILKEAFLYHNTDYHGDDLQICMNIHQLKGKKYYRSNQVHTRNYKVKTATNMVGTTDVPKCWVHYNSIISILPSALAKKLKRNDCTCGNPDLFAQRSKGWFVSKHRFIPKYIRMILNVNGIHGLWVRMVAFYELVIILNEYFAIIYIFFFMKNIDWWLLEGFLIGYSFTVIVMTFFNWQVLRPNKQYIPYEFITMQPLIYKIFMITIYRYLGLLYNLCIYSIQHKSGTKIIKRLEDEKFKHTISEMYHIPNNKV
jgi:hypothetical protein